MKSKRLDLRPQARPLVPSEAPEPPRCVQMDVTRRAYYLWEQAGHPDGRAEEFYFEAERQLRELQRRGS